MENAAIQEIGDLYQTILQRWNEQDAAGMAAQFTEAGSMVGFDGSQINSRVDIAGHLAPIFADHPTAVYIAKVREIRLIDERVGLLRAVAGMVPRNGNKINPDLNTIHSLVAVCQDDDTWQAELFQSTPAAWDGRSADREALTQELAETLSKK